MRKPQWDSYDNRMRLDHLRLIANSKGHKMGCPYCDFWKNYAYVRIHNGGAVLTNSGRAFLDPHNQSEDYFELSDKDKKVLDTWIAVHLKRRNTINKHYTSYGLKQFFEFSPVGFYITNGMFKGAMLQAGFYIFDQFEINWRFNIAQISITRLHQWINNPK